VESLIAGMTVIPHVMTQTVVLLCCLAYMGWLAWKLLLVFLTALIGGFVLYHFLKKEPLRQLRQLREKMGVLYGHFRNLVEGSRELQLNAQRGRLFVDRVLAPDAQEFRHMYVRGYARLSLIANFGDVLFYLVIGLILFVAPLWLSYDGHVYTAFTMVLLFLIGPISTSINAVPVIAQAVVAFDQIRRLDVVLAEDETQEQANPFDNGRAFSLQLREVCHHYPGLSDDHRFQLGPLNLAIGQGELLFIIGGNGSGKTTLAMLLLGLYLPEQGGVVLNGVAVDARNVAHYRSHFSAVFADFHLFRHVLDDAEQNAERERRAAYFLDKLGVGHKVHIADGQFSTIDLSSGQRKRLALVSAYLEDRPVYLFDEWAADQDPVFKRVFYMELLPELKARGKTVIVISHDDAYFAQADRLLRLQDGQLHSLVAQTDGSRAVA
jgi:putative ATP-binding cassette transporter